MIIVGGTEVAKEALPYSDVSDYVIENNISTLRIRLKTIARSDTCVAVYVNSELLEQVRQEITEEVETKMTVFNSDYELMSVILGESTEVVEEEEVVEREDIPEFGNQPEDIKERSVDVVDVTAIDAFNEEVEVLDLPIVTDGTFSIQSKLNIKEMAIRERDNRIVELQEKIEELYRIQEEQLMAMESEYNLEIDKANKIIADLGENSITREEREFLKFLAYAENPKGVVKPVFGEGFAATMQTHSGIVAASTGSGLSPYLLGNNLKQLLDAKSALVVDLTGDVYFKSKMVSDGKDVLSCELGDVDKITINDGVDVVHTGLFNDIALLTVRWEDFLNNVQKEARGRDVVILFGGLRSFAVRHVFSLFATVVPSYVVAECSPMVLATLSVDAAFIPSNRFKIVIVNYIKELKPLLERMNEHNAMDVYGESISWDKLFIE